MQWTTTNIKFNLTQPASTSVPYAQHLYHKRSKLKSPETEKKTHDEIDSNTKRNQKKKKNPCTRSRNKEMVKVPSNRIQRENPWLHNEKKIRWISTAEKSDRERERGQNYVTRRNLNLVDLICFCKHSLLFSLSHVHSLTFFILIPSYFDIFTFATYDIRCEIGTP